MHSKPAKYGTKYFCLCDVDTSYLCNVQVYVGREFEQSERNKNIGMNVVLDLVKSIENSGRGVTTDNFFTSIPLADKLWEKKLTFVETMRANKRAIPPQFQKNKNRVLHDIKFGFQKEKTLVSYVPQLNKAVILLSTEHHDKSVKCKV